MVTLRVRESVRGLLPLPRLSDTRTVKLNVPTAFAVPLRIPTLDSSSPEGRAPEMTDHRYGGDREITLSVQWSTAETKDYRDRIFPF
jgi:hypothetical protein